MGKVIPITDEERAAVIEYWENNHDNTAPDICNALGYGRSKVESILRKYFGDRFNK